MARPVMPVLEYIINYDYITNVLCVNKAKPMLHCNGKCHLMKELAKAAEQDKPVSEKKTGHIEAETLFCNPVAAFVINTPATFTLPKSLPSYSNLYAHLTAHAVFHPPTVIS